MDDLTTSQSLTVDELVSLLQNADPEKRLDAVQALGKTGQPSILPHLGDVLEQDSDVLVRRFSIGALKGLNKVEAIPYFWKATQDSDANIRNLAEQAVIESLGESAQSEEKLELARVQEIITQIGQHIITQLLNQTLLNSSNDPNLRRLAAIALGRFSQGTAIETLGRALIEDGTELVRQAAATALGDTKQEGAVPFLEKALRKGDTEGVVKNIIAALNNIGKPQAIQVLGGILIKNPDTVLRELAAQNLWRTEATDVAIPYLCQALLEDKSENVRRTVEITLSKIDNWSAKTNEILKTLQSGKLERAQIDATAIVRAIRLPEDLTQQTQFVEDLIGVALTLEDNPRMITFIAAILIAVANSSSNLAGERVNAYAKTRSIPESRLRLLRIEIGGLTALNPILELLKQNEVLQQNLKDDFQTPINELNTNTRNMWKDTIQHAQYGFRARIYMSIITFAVGVILVIASFIKVMIGDLTPEELVGPGISLGSGIITMLLTTFYGPLKQIRQSVNDLGVASAAFIAYVHRVSQISHTFSFYYLKQRITFEEMEKSSGLIERAMDSTVKNLNQAEPNDKTSISPANSTSP